MAIARLMPLINMTDEQKTDSRANNLAAMRSYRLSNDPVHWHDHHLKLLNATRNLFLNTRRLDDLKSWFGAMLQAMAYGKLKQAESCNKLFSHQAELQMFWSNFLTAHIELLESLENNLQSKERFKLYEHVAQLGKEINKAIPPQKTAANYSLKKGEHYNSALDGDEAQNDQMTIALIEHQGNLETHQTIIKQHNRQQQMAFCKTFCCFFSRRNNQPRSAEVQHDMPVYNRMN